MMKKILYLSVFLFCVSALESFAQPKLPYKDIGACPFECCVYDRWTANKSTNIFSTMEAKSAIAFKVAKGEKITALTGVVITEQAGIFKAKKTTIADFYNEKTKKTTKVKISKGEKIYLLTYQGEGFYVVWYQNKISSFEVTQDFEEVTQPKSVWWVKVKNKRGKIGWTKLTENFDGKDKCG